MGGILETESAIPIARHQQAQLRHIMTGPLEKIKRIVRLIGTLRIQISCCSRCDSIPLLLAERLPAEAVVAALVSRCVEPSSEQQAVDSRACLCECSE